MDRSPRNEGRNTILTAIRRGLRRGELPADQAAMVNARLAHPPRHLAPARTALDRRDLVALFLANIEREFGTTARLAEPRAAPGAIAEYLASLNLPPSLVIAPHPELDALPWDERPMLTRRRGRTEGDDAVSLTQAFAGIAETGTLMLPSAPERPTTLNLLPDTSIVLVRASRVVATYEAAWDRLRAEHRDARTGGFMPRNVMLVTGPSRSADIEQTLELGAHGPRRLHVLLVDDDPAAVMPEAVMPEAVTPEAAMKGGTVTPAAP